MDAKPFHAAGEKGLASLDMEASELLRIGDHATLNLMFHCGNEQILRNHKERFAGKFHENGVYDLVLRDEFFTHLGECV